MAGRSASPERIPHASSSSHARHRERDEEHRRRSGEKGSSSSHHRHSQSRTTDSRSRSDRDRDDRHHRSKRPDRYVSDEEEERERRHRSSRREEDWDADRRREHDRDRHHRHHHRETSRERAERKRRHREHRSDRDRGAGEGSDPLKQQRRAEERAKAAETLLYATGLEGNGLVGQEDPSSGGQDGGGIRTFTWAKKAERERKMGLTPAEARQRDLERRREAEEEIDRLNTKRMQREREQAQREEEQAHMNRMAESTAMAEWVAKEDQFSLEQARKRAVIRVREQRAKPIDLLAINLKWIKPTANQRQAEDAEHPAYQHTGVDNDEDEADDLDIDLEEPYLLFDNLNLEETEELQQDIQMYLGLEKDTQNVDFWRAMVTICDDHLVQLRDEDDKWRIDPTVRAEMDQMLSSKSLDQLYELQDQVKDKLQGQEAIDTTYWQGLQRTILVWQAKAKLRDLHETILHNRLEHLRQRQRIEQERRQRLGLPSLEEERVARAAEAAARRAEREARMHPDDAIVDDMLAQEAAKPLGEGEEVMDALPDTLPSMRGMAASHGETGEEGATTYAWEDKYRPRKPRYFNKVHTGYEWNKYNQTHYDHDNPPPKQVQGYKFNIFYPDLIDKSKPPTFRIVKEPGNEETCLLIFEAGPPYETVAFRIVNKPWNMSHQRGFRAVFERGVLQLYFNFQRMFYRK